jgi:hypothetical protein
MPFNLEVTDTFGGEPNYCWVKRGPTKATSRRGVIRALKKLAGWDGWCRVKGSTTTVTTWRSAPPSPVVSTKWPSQPGRRSDHEGVPLLRHH